MKQLGLEPHVKSHVFAIALLRRTFCPAVRWQQASSPLADFLAYFVLCALKLDYKLMLKSCRQLSMTVRSPHTAASNAPGPWLLRQTYSWIDRQGRPVSPPLEYARASPPVLVAPPPPPPRWNYSRNTKDRPVRKNTSVERQGYSVHRATLHIDRIISLCDLQPYTALVSSQLIITPRYRVIA
ncbi:Deafness, autosomal recessive [Homalodisca vitripennis]|nr:Deafness, autosomal recessive [Homalodisca vitripennis]